MVGIYNELFIDWCTHNGGSRWNNNSLYFLLLFYFCNLNCKSGFHTAVSFQRQSIQMKYYADANACLSYQKYKSADDSYISLNEQRDQLEPTYSFQSIQLLQASSLSRLSGCDMILHNGQKFAWRSCVVARRREDRNEGEDGEEDGNDADKEQTSLLSPPPSVRPPSSAFGSKAKIRILCLSHIGRHQKSRFQLTVSISQPRASYHDVDTNRRIPSQPQPFGAANTRRCYELS